MNTHAKFLAGSRLTNKSSKPTWSRKLIWTLTAIIAAAFAAFFTATLAMHSAYAQQPLPKEAVKPKPATRPDDAAKPKPLPSLPKAPGVKADYHPPSLGLQLRNLATDELKTNELKYGVFVERAIGTAGSAGIKAEDIITKVNGRPVADVDRFWKLAEAAKWKFTVTVWRGNTLISIAIEDV
jgi:S1-C subfamily serine protease